MSTELTRGVVTGVLALLTAGVIALVNSWISTRAGIDENLRDQRLAAYPELWKATGAVPRWPRTEPTRGQLEQLHESYRTWYYSKGGLFMSESARARYGDVQELLDAVLQHKSPDGVLTAGAYTDLMLTTSALRTAMTQDLDTRRRRSVLQRWQRARWHRKAAADAQVRIKRTAASSSPFEPR
ncbi:hypothetical protein OHA70_28050 [Kribbella sp. NBC_00382]|uniref:hypothetical protein n=1 Tax=Kribbella sp. NBC_00382 TaxID=2975967 RepID=UPI002E1E9267